MPTIIHLSDLHFGPHFIAHLAELILQDILTVRPDLVIISGDFTMRGRISEYERARAYLEKLPEPVLTIPGNHDQPLHGNALVERLTRPWSRYRQFIHPEINAAFEGPGLFVVGLNDNHNILPGGIWTLSQRRWMQAQFTQTRPGRCKVLVMHHHLSWDGKLRPAGQWFPTRTLNRLASLGVELVLNGHTHVPSARLTPQGIVIAQAGTAMSGRTRGGHANCYNQILISDEEIKVINLQYDPKRDRFATDKQTAFARQRST